MQLDKEQVEKIKDTLEDIKRAKSDYDIYRDFIILCNQNNINIPDKIKNFIVSNIESQQQN